MRIADTGGRPLGYVTGALALHADDPALRSVWDEVDLKRPKSDDEAEPWIAAFLRGKGYRVE